MGRGEAADACRRDGAGMIGQTDTCVPPPRPMALRATMIAAAILVLAMACAAGFTVWNLHERVEGESQSGLAKLSLVIAEQTSRSFESVDIVLKQAADRLVANRADDADAIRSSMDGAPMHQYLAHLALNLARLKT
jgi:hypothetical protein